MSLLLLSDHRDYVLLNLQADRNYWVRDKISINCDNIFKKLIFNAFNLSFDKHTI